MKTVSKTKLAGAMALGLAVAMPQMAFASAGLAGVTGFANTILGFMTGPIATIAGAIAIAIVGYRWFSGRMELGRAAAAIAGIVLVIGSAQIVNWIRGGAALAGPVGPISFNDYAPTQLAEADFAARLYPVLSA